MDRQRWEEGSRGVWELERPYRSSAERDSNHMVQCAVPQAQHDGSSEELWSYRFKSELYLQRGSLPFKQKPNRFTLQNAASATKDSFEKLLLFSC